MDFAIVVLRALLSLAVVLGLVWFASKRFAGQRRPGAVRSGGRGRQRSNPIQVVGRQSLAPKVSLALVDVGSQRFLLGVSEQGVSVVTTTAVPEVEPELEVVREEIDLSAAAESFVDPEAARQLATSASAASTASVASTAAAASVAASTTSSSALAGSILSAATWREALDMLRARTVRR